MFNFLLGRVGRYPAMRDGGPTWSGVFADTNPWDVDHWLHEASPAGACSSSPAGCIWDGKAWVPNPAAENLINLPAGYYERQLAGQTEDWIRVYLGGEYGFCSTASRSIRSSSTACTCRRRRSRRCRTRRSLIGVDFGLTPAAVFCQLDARGRWRVLGRARRRPTWVRPHSPGC